MSVEIVTVVLNMAHGTQAVQGRIDDPTVVEAMTPRPNVVIEVLRDTPAAAVAPLAALATEPEPAPVKTAEAKAAVGPVGPAPDLEAKKSVTVPKSPTGARKPRGE